MCTGPTLCSFCFVSEHHFSYIAELYTVLVSSQKLFKFSLIKDIYCVKCNLAFILVFFQGLLAMNNMRKRSLKRLREALSRTLESKIKQRISFTLGCSLNLKCDTISLGCVVLRRENIKDISQHSVMVNRWIDCWQRSQELTLKKNCVHKVFFSYFN